MVSVVIPLYNKERSIVRTLESVLAQTNTGFECIIINDGSTDRSAEIVKEWIENINAHQSTINLPLIPFRLINKENSGVSSARDVGIRESSRESEYIAFLDADDEWEPGYLEEMMRLIKDYPDAGLYAMGFQKVYADGRKETYSNFKDGYLDNPWTEPYPFSTASSVMCRKEVLQELGEFDERVAMGEDLDMWWRILLKYKGAVCSNVLVSYNQDAENRAMHTGFPIEQHIVNYIEKYQEARNENAAFRKYFDIEMIYRLYPYLFDKQYKKEVRRLADMLDYCQLKRSLRYRMVHPYGYRLFLGIKKLLHK